MSLIICVQETVNESEFGSGIVPRPVISPSLTLGPQGYKVAVLGASFLLISDTTTIPTIHQELTNVMIPMNGSRYMGAVCECGVEIPKSEEELRFEKAARSAPYQQIIVLITSFLLSSDA